MELFKIECTGVSNILFKRPVIEYVKIKVTVFMKFSDSVILFKSELLYAVIKFFKGKVIAKVYKKNGFSREFKAYDVVRIFFVKVFP